MIVWVLEFGEYEDRFVAGVFSSKENATDLLNRRGLSFKRSYESCLGLSEHWEKGSGRIGDIENESARLVQYEMDEATGFE